MKIGIDKIGSKHEKPIRVELSGYSWGDFICLTVNGRNRNSDVIVTISLDKEDALDILKSIEWE